jgi:hypothetical protein
MLAAGLRWRYNPRGEVQLWMFWLALPLFFVPVVLRACNMARLEMKRHVQAVEVRRSA